MSAPSHSNLDKMNLAIQNLSGGTGFVEVRRPDLGFVAKLQAGRLYLKLNDGRHLQTVSLDLSDPINKKFLNQLAEGFVGSAKLHSIEQAIVKAGCLVSAMTQPLFKKMSYGSPKAIEVTAHLDDAAKVKTLEAKMEGSVEPIKISSEAELKKITEVIEQHFGYDKVGFKVKLAKRQLYGIAKADQKQFLNWLIQPVPAASYKLMAMVQGNPDLLEELESILDKPDSEWKEEIWQNFGADLKSLKDVQIGYNGATGAALLKRIQFQELIREFVTSAWKTASAVPVATPVPSPVPGFPTPPTPLASHLSVPPASFTPPALPTPPASFPPHSPSFSLIPPVLPHSSSSSSSSSSSDPT